MHGAVCDQPRPENDPGYNPDLSCAVPGGDTAHKAHTVRLPDVLRRCGTFPRYGKFCFRYFAGDEKIPRNAKNPPEIREFSWKRDKKNVLSITTLTPVFRRTTATAEQHYVTCVAIQRCLRQRALKTYVAFCFFCGEFALYHEVPLNNRGVHRFKENAPERMPITQMIMNVCTTVRAY